MTAENSQRAVREPRLDYSYPQAVSAKLNLTLAVGKKRSDGYHMMQSLLVPISLKDKINVMLFRRSAQTQTAERISLDCDLSVHLAKHVEMIAKQDSTVFEVIKSLNGPENLAWRAAELFAARALLPDDIGITIELRKHIPFAAGLGGGSADAAAVLRGLNELCNGVFSEEGLSELGAELGCDVPALLHGGPVFVYGKGDTYRPLEFSEETATALEELGVVIVKPCVSVSTADAYKLLGREKCAAGEEELKLASASIPEQLLAEFGVAEIKGTNKHRKILTFAEGTGSSDGLDSERRAIELGAKIFNDFEAVVFDNYYQVSRARELLAGQGVQHIHLAGSGSALFGITSSVVEARRIETRLEGIAPDGWFVQAAQLLPRDSCLP